MRKKLKFYITRSAPLFSGMEMDQDEIYIEVPNGIEGFDSLLSFELAMSHSLADFLGASVTGELQLEAEIERMSSYE
jgi:hypothetical protein